MRFLKRNYGWLLVTILAALPLVIVGKMVEFEFANGLSFSLIPEAESAEKSTLDMLYHITGEFSIRWMTAVLTLTPFFILFGVTNLFVRQAMGIATAVWSLLHFLIFIWAEGLLETFTQANYVAGFIAVLILVPLLVTSNRNSIKRLKSNWKKLQRFAYAAIFLSLIHIVLLEKTWLIYAIIVSIGFILRIPVIKSCFIQLRITKNTDKS
jgi:methionine sulfoxide reductase heme-binding subunit